MNAPIQYSVQLGVTGGLLSMSVYGFCHSLYPFLGCFVHRAHLVTPNSPAEPDNSSCASNRNDRTPLSPAEAENFFTIDAVSGELRLTNRAIRRGDRFSLVISVSIPPGNNRPEITTFLEHLRAFERVCLEVIVRELKGFTSFGFVTFVWNNNSTQYVLRNAATTVCLPLLRNRGSV